MTKIRLYVPPYTVCNKPTLLETLWVFSSEETVCRVRESDARSVRSDFSLAAKQAFRKFATDEYLKVNCKDPLVVFQLLEQTKNYDILRVVPATLGGDNSNDNLFLVEPSMGESIRAFIRAQGYLEIGERAVRLCPKPPKGHIWTCDFC